MKRLLLAAGLLAALGSAAIAQVTPPQLSVIGPTDLFQDIPNGTPSPQNYYVPGSLLGGYGATQPGNNPDNALIGGDFTTNLWSYGTSVALASSTYYVAYTADRWFAWGGTSTPGTITQQSDAPTDYLYSLRLNKGSLTGTKALTVAQVVEGVNSYQFQSQTAEFDCHMKAGAGFSAANSAVLMNISYGTVADEGATTFAYGLNAQGGAGTTAWTGQVNASVLVPITTTWQRYSIVAPIGATAAEIAASVGYTPVGTGTSTDWVEIAGCQLVRNNALAGVAGTTTGTATALNVNDARAKSFSRRPQAVETAMQQRYHWRINEPAASVAVSMGGTYYAATTCLVEIPNPVPMRIAPTLTFGTLDASHWAIIANSATPIVLASTWLVQSALGANTVNETAITATTASKTAGFGCVLVGNGGTGSSYIDASAEL